LEEVVAVVAAELSKVMVVEEGLTPKQ